MIVRHQHGRAMGYSLLEVVIATFIVSVVLIGAMRLVGSATVGQEQNAARARADMLAAALLDEILTQHFDEPIDPPAFGPETGETAGDRSAFDDVDDYHNWTASPPQQQDGTAYPNYAGWLRRVEVVFVDPNDLTSVVAGDQGVKRITVFVFRDTRELAAQSTVITAHWPHL